MEAGDDNNGRKRQGRASSEGTDGQTGTSHDRRTDQEVTRGIDVDRLTRGGLLLSVPVCLVSVTYVLRVSEGLVCRVVPQLRQCLAGRGRSGDVEVLSGQCWLTRDPGFSWEYLA